MPQQMYSVFSRKITISTSSGRFTGEGPFTPGAPEQPFPLAVSFTLADGTDVADAVPPQGSRGWVQGYLRTRAR